MRTSSLVLLALAAVPLLGAPAAAQPLFRDATATHLPAPASVEQRSMDVESADLDGDGDLDLVVPQEFGPNKVLLNDGTAHFTNGSAGLPTVPPTEVPPPAPRAHDSEDVSIADFTGDGILDLVIVSEDDVVMGRSNVHEYYRGVGNGTFVRIYGEIPDTEANAVAHADLTGDGALDLLVVGAGQDRLLVNDGTGGFTDETATRLPVETLVGQDAEFVDVDGDGDLDLAIGNEGGHRLWINDGTAHFTDDTAARLPDPGNVEARKVTPVDLNGDGAPDLYFSHVGWEGRQPQDRLLINDGTGHYTDETAARIPAESLTSLDAKFADLDEDGDLDMAHVNLGEGTGALRILLNDGTGRFTDETATVLPGPLSGPGLGVEIADFDDDGHLDLYVAMLINADPTAFDRLYLHNGASSGMEGGAGDDGVGPHLYGLRPNPAKGGAPASVAFRLDAPGTARLVLVDALGREVAVLGDSPFPAGLHVLPVHLPPAAAGSLFLRLDADGHTVTRPVTTL